MSKFSYILQEKQVPTDMAGTPASQSGRRRAPCLALLAIFGALSLQIPSSDCSMAMMTGIAASPNYVGQHPQHLSGNYGGYDRIRPTYPNLLQGFQWPKWQQQQRDHIGSPARLDGKAASLTSSRFMEQEPFPYLRVGARKNLCKRVHARRLSIETCTCFAPKC